MTGLLLEADALLRGSATLVDPRRWGYALARLVLLIVLFGMLYGSVMGSFGGLAGDRFLQVVFSALKVPLMLLATFAVSLPTFFVLNTLLGLRSDFREAVRALVATQAALAIVLASMAPLTLLLYASVDPWAPHVKSQVYQGAILFNGVMFAIASFSAQYVLRRFYRRLIARNRRHRVMLWSWIALYCFVGIQMGWMLRPFVGTPGSAVEFFRSETWGNAYLLIFRMLDNVLR